MAYTVSAPSMAQVRRESEVSSSKSDAGVGKAWYGEQRQVNLAGCNHQTSSKGRSAVKWRL